MVRPDAEWANSSSTFRISEWRDGEQWYLSACAWLSFRVTCPSGRSKTLVQASDTQVGEKCGAEDGYPWSSL